MAQKTDIKPIAQKIAVSRIEDNLPKVPESQGVGAVNLISGAVLAITGFLKGKQEAKKQQRVQAAKDATSTYIDNVLGTLENVGYQLINQNQKPGTLEFETLLKKNLYDEIGYLGYCNANIWGPDSEQFRGKPERPIWFTIKGGGINVTPSPGLHVPANIADIWYQRCRTIREGWVTAYRQKLIREGRIQELEQLDSAYSRANIIYWVALSGIMGILLFILFKKGKK